MPRSGFWHWWATGCAACLSLSWPIAAGASETASGVEAPLVGTPSLAAPGLVSRYVQGAGGVPLNVIEGGQRGKPALVFIHGLGQSHLSWEKQFSSGLADDFHLIAYDLRGHGHSGKPWLAADYAAPEVWATDLQLVLEATNAKEPVLVAWSFGTWVAVDFLITHQTTAIRGLVMVGSLGGLIAPLPLSQQPMSEEGMRLGEQAQSGWLGDSFERGEGINRFFARKPIDPVWSQRVAAANALLPPYARQLILARSFDNSGAIDRLHAPIWLVVGDEDVNVGVHDASALMDRLPNAQLTIFEGTGHFPFAEEPDRFNRELAVFASQTQ